MNTKFLALAASLLLVTACETPPAQDGGAIGGGEMGAAGNRTGAFSGLYGDESVGQLAQGVPDRVFFATDSSVLDAQAQTVLQLQAGFLKDNGNTTVTIEGHCDERASREYNLALGERRANAVKNYLVGLGVPANRVETLSYGKERPAVEGHSESSWAKNRRGVTVVVR